MSDDQENDVFDADDAQDDSVFEDFDSGAEGLSDAVKTNPILKIGIVIAAIAVIAAGIMLFGGKEAPLETSMMKQGKDISEVAGTANVSEAYKDAVRERDEQVIEEAQRTGTSAMPVPIGPPKSAVTLAKPETEGEDPLERWRRIQEERLRKEQELAAFSAAKQPVEAQPVAVDPYAEQKSTLASSFATQMQSILDGMNLEGMETASVADAGFLEEKKREEAQINETAAQNAATAVPGDTVEILIEPGRIEYAQLLIEANTDAPGPVLAVLASGPLAGSRMIGSFSSSTEYLTLMFKTVVVDGQALTTNAVALDPATSKAGVITEIDHKYFQRVILPAAASFIKGIGEAIADSGSTTVSAGTGTTTTANNDLDSKQEFFKGVSEASDKVSEILEEDGSAVKPMLRVAAGTHIGILFIEPVERTISATGAVVIQSKNKEEPGMLSGASVSDILSNIPAPPNQIQTSATPTGQ